MSTSIDIAFVKQFEREVKETYQRRGSKLMNAVRNKPDVVGSTTTFQKVGTGVATTKARHGTVTPMNVDHTAVECTLQDFYAGDWVDKLDEMKVQHDEKRVIVNAGAFALGRKTDELVIAELDGTAKVEAHAASGMTKAKILSAMQKLGDADVFEEGRMFAIVPWTEWTELLDITEFKSADFARDNYPWLEASEAKRWLGTIWMPHSGLESLTATGVSKAFWFHQDAVGWAHGTDVTTDITWHGDRAAHFVNNMLSGGACLIDGDGVVEIQSQRS
tara:strand:- start:1555 stop:2379 length:825 start_codon:yes stop_codon:yes gene_type:complete